MKGRKIEKELKKEAREFTPDIYDKIVRSAKSEGLLEDKPDRSKVYAFNAPSKKKKWIITGVSTPIFAIACVLIISLVLRTATPIVPSHINLSTNDVYGMGAVSTVRLLGGNTSVKALKSFTDIRSLSEEIMPLDKNDTATDSQSEVKKQAEKFNEYFTALDGFMGENIVSTVSEKNTDGYPYDQKLTISGKNLDGEVIKHVMYYTETLSQGDSDDDLDDDDDDDDQSDEVEAEETESTYTLKGIMMVDGLEYYLEGERSIETEGTESENQLKIRAYADLADKSSYVEMEQEHSKEEGETETEYVYSIYSNGVLVEQTAIDFEAENENGKEEVEYELEFRTGDAKGKYLVERETQNGKTLIKVRYDVDGKRGEFHVKNTDNVYVYVFSDGTELTF